jgi:ATP-dependent helicase Lhr and Lhr-like helicase
VVLDELHSLVTSKRGTCCRWGWRGCAASRRILRAIGLSATVAQPEELRRWLVAQDGRLPMADLIEVGRREARDHDPDSKERVPWAGHSARYSMPELYEAIREHKTTLLFVNTRSQAELLFQELWRVNDDTLPIALHHGSLDVGQRRKVEKAMETGSCAPSSPPPRSTSASTGAMSISSSMSARRRGRAGSPSASAAPTTASTSRAGRSWCRPTASRCWSAGPRSRPIIWAPRTRRRCRRRARRARPARDGHGLRRALRCRRTLCRGDERRALCRLDRETFDRVVDFVATGGYALRVYERYARIRRRRRGAGASAIRGWPSSTGSMSAPSSRRPISRSAM